MVAEGFLDHRVDLVNNILREHERHVPPDSLEEQEAFVAAEKEAGKNRVRINRDPRFAPSRGDLSPLSRGRRGAAE